VRTTSARLAATAELAATAKLVAAKLAAGAIVKPASVHRVAAVFAGSAAIGAKAGGNPPTTCTAKRSIISITRKPGHRNIVRGSCRSARTLRI
jgi:hypothetical protein